MRPPPFDISNLAGLAFKLTPYDFDKLVSYKSPKFPTDKPFNIPRPINYQMSLNHFCLDTRT